MERKARSLAVTICLLMCGLELHAGTQKTNSSVSGEKTTAVAGESWLNHLHRSFGDTSMGKTGRLGPAATEGEKDTPGWQFGLLTYPQSGATLTGRDLYRLNCQPCHGEEGGGAPPEINSVIDPVRATSAPLLIERMKARGMDVSRADAAQMAKQAEDALLLRLQNGGQDMPAFPQLSDREVRALIGYLKQLSGVPGAAQITVSEPTPRVGEMIVKSTCHICHDATGPNPTPQQLEAGAIPPLETLTARTDELQFIRKVTAGAPVLMGDPLTPHRGRMPVFDYLSRDEVADAYLYLFSYPPSHLDANVPMVAVTQYASDRADPPAGPSAFPRKAQSAPARPERTRSQPFSEDGFLGLLAALGGFVFTLLIGGVGFAAYELRRLSQRFEVCKADTNATPTERTEIRELVA